jgi:hypothetical protein
LILCRHKYNDPEYDIAVRTFFNTGRTQGFTKLENPHFGYQDIKSFKDLQNLNVVVVGQGEGYLGHIRKRVVNQLAVQTCYSSLSYKRRPQVAEADLVIVFCSVVIFLLIVLN